MNFSPCQRLTLRPLSIDVARNTDTMEATVLGLLEDVRLARRRSVQVLGDRLLEFSKNPTRTEEFLAQQLAEYIICDSSVSEYGSKVLTKFLLANPASQRYLGFLQHLHYKVCCRCRTREGKQIQGFVAAERILRDAFIALPYRSPGQIDSRGRSPHQQE